ncbi:D-glycerate dehydrogenase [Patescibacteria group bacterium]|nr:D-glycerate dehydrogenase [Patescibacteria group bacterium]
MVKKYKVFITRPIPEVGIKMLQKHFKVQLRKKDSPITKSELEKGIKNCDAILTILTDKVDGKLLDLNPNLKIVSNYAVGYNNIDIEACTKRGVLVGNTPDVLTTSTAESVFPLLLGVSKRLIEGDDIMRSGKFPGWGPMYLLGTELKGKILGIAGAGRIGSETALMANKGFGMNIIYYNLNKNSQLEKKTGAKRVSFDKLLKDSDVISIHVPYMPETHHMFGTKEFKKMKNTAFIINTARGPIINEKALVSALKKGDIGGAGLDVFENEPKLEPGLAKLKNVVMTPHTGSATWEARNAMAEVAAQNIIGALLPGKKPISIVNL